MTSPDDTAPHGAHSAIDPLSMAERAADKAHDAKQIAMHADDRSAEALMLSRRHAEMIELLPAMKVQLDLALSPIQLRTRDRLPMWAAAAAMVISACALVVLVVLFARVPTASAAVPVAPQAAYRVP